MSCPGSCQPKGCSCQGGLAQALLKGIDGVLGARDAVGAVIKPVYFLTRTWYKDPAKTIPALRPEGYAVDSAPLVQMCPSPSLKDYSQDLRVREGGAIRSGDIVLRNVSKNRYTEADLESSRIGNVEKLYIVGTKVYQVINITEQLVTFSVQLRELTNQTRY